MKPAPFTYVRPASLAEALDALATHAGDARPIAGGQSLMPMLNMRLATVDYLVDIERLPGLDRITPVSDGGLELGALVRHRDLVSSEQVRSQAPLLAECAPLIGHAAIRNRGTLGGSIAHADPAAELPAALLALDATIHVACRDGERTIAARDFFVDVFTTALQSGELVVGVRIPPARPGAGWAFREQARRRGDFALAGAAVGVTLDEAGVCTGGRVVILGAGAAPARSANAESALVGRPLNDSAAARKAAAEAVRLAVAPLRFDGDVHASGSYRKEAARVCAERALMAALQRAALVVSGGGHL